MASHGGKRPNTPPPPPRKGQKWAHTLAKETAREMVRQTITEHLGTLIEAQVAQAHGIKYLVVRDKLGRFTRIPETITPEEMDALLADADQVLEVWTKDPSTPAFTDLMNRAIDKPKEQEVEVLVGIAEQTLRRLDAWKEQNRRQKELEDQGDRLLEAHPEKE